jgi:SAM-dependent methyltransferase
VERDGSRPYPPGKRTILVSVLGAKREGHIEGFREELASLNRDDFFLFFDNAPDINASFIRGAWDLGVHVLQPLVSHVREADRLTALEIGYGGGRLLLSACRSYHRAIGLDVHDRTDLVAEELTSRGVDNFDLLVGDGQTIPLGDGSVDVVYSLIVFQHLEHIEIAQGYFSELARVLRVGGTAVIYVGRRTYGGHQSTSLAGYLLDRALETVDRSFAGGYRERHGVAVNETNLQMRVPYARRLAQDVGLAVLSAGRPNTGLGGRRGRQHRLVLAKRL